MKFANPTGRVGSRRRVSATSGSKYARASGATVSGSLAMLQITTHGWFLSRATSSRIAWRWISCVRALIVASLYVVNPSAAPRMGVPVSRLSPTAAVSSMTTTPCRSA